MAQYIDVLVAFEESGVVRRAFRGREHRAISNDLVAPRDGSRHHLQIDARKAIDIVPVMWDLIIMHPPCDYLAVSGNRWYGQGTPGHHLREEALEWTIKTVELALKKAHFVAVENPVGVLLPELQRRLFADVQWVQPWMFGHPEFKATGFALFGLPPLEPVRALKPPKKGTPEHREWQKVWRMTPSENRKRDRSETYLGIADAMADQWGRYIMASKASDKFAILGDITYERNKAVYGGR